MTGRSCRACGSDRLRQVIDLGPMPIAHRLLETSDADEKRFPMVLHVCEACGLTQIVDPIDPNILYGQYNYNFSSWKPEPHLDDELDTICAAGVPRSAVEIGCNDGRFLAELASRGVAKCVGVEPNPISGPMARERGFEVVSSMLSESVCRDIRARHDGFELVVARQVLEHLHDIEGFFACVDMLLAEGGRLFIDVPDAETGLDIGDCSILWEEHVSYFTEKYLESMLRAHGFEAATVRRYNFSGGTVAVLARRSADGPDTRARRHAAPALVAAASAFGAAVKDYGNALRSALAHARERNYQVIMYGVGCRACTATNALGLGPLIEFAVDDQEERQRKFMPGSRLAIRAPAAAAEGAGPILCLLAVNNENEETVMQRFRERLDRPVAFASLFSPRNIVDEAKSIAALPGSMP